MPQPQENDTDTIPTPRPRPSKRLILGAACLAALLVAAGYAWYWRGKVETDDAFVDGHSHSVTPRVTGYVTTVAVEDNQRVELGQLLAEIDPTDLRVALAQAQADLASAESELTALELGVPLELSQTSSRVSSARAQLEAMYKTLDQTRQEEEAARQAAVQAKAQVDQALLDLARFRTLRAKDVVAQADIDNAVTRQRSSQAEFQSATARADSLVHRRASLEKDVERLKAEITLAQSGQETAVIKDKEALAQRARVELARQRVIQAELNLSYTRIVSPATGHVTKRRVEPGLMVAQGQPLMAIVPLDPRELWITANFKETQLTHMRPGQPALVEVDSYPGRSLRGRVDSIMSGTGAVFSLFPPENASGNYVKIVQRIPVKIVLDPDQELPELRLGMSAVPVVLTR